jgi:hypothetical protein
MEHFELDDKTLSDRSNVLTSLVPTTSLINKLSSPNLIVECCESDHPFTLEGAEFVVGVTRRRTLRFNYVLFERDSGSLAYVGISYVEAPSDGTVQSIFNAAHEFIKSIHGHSKKKGYLIEVYEV